MKDDSLVGSFVMILSVATIYLLMAGVAIAMARDGLVLWADASAAVELLSMFATFAVAAVVLVQAARPKPTETEE